MLGAGYTRILYNLFREIGVWEKQSSAFFQAKAAESHLQGNVVFNLARAGFNVRRHAPSLGCLALALVHGCVPLRSCA